MANVTYLNNVNEEKVERLLNDTEVNASYFNETALSVASKASEPLDNIMKTIRGTLLRQVDGELVSDGEIENYYLELTNTIYFMAERMETLAVYSDMSTAAQKEVYNKALLESAAEKDEKGKSLRTVAENTSVAENASQYESIVASIYAHAYKILRFKVDEANELVSTLKYVLKKRMQDAYLSANAPTKISGFDGLSD